METRRGFLKTLGKLTAAVGLTAAAVSTVEAKKGTTPSGEVDHETFLDIMETPKVPKDALLDFKPNGDVVRTPIVGVDVASNSHTVPKNREIAKLKAGFSWTSGKKLEPGSLIPTQSYVHPGYHFRNSEENMLAQDTMNRMYSAHADNIRMAYPPQMVMSIEAYNQWNKMELIRTLDPYNWGQMFNLEWQGWKQRDPEHVTTVGIWTATVNPKFRGIFEHEHYYQSQAVAIQYLKQCVKDGGKGVLKHAKEQCYRQLVDMVQDVILKRIARDVKNQPVLMTNVCLNSPRDVVATLKGITD